MESDPEIQKALEEHAFTRDFPLHHRIKLARLATRQVTPAGGYLQRAGEDIERFHLLRRGTAVVELPLPTGRAERLMVLGPGDAAGWSWMVEPYTAQFDVRALESTETLALDGVRLREQVEDDNHLGYLLLKRLLEIVGRGLKSTRVQRLEEAGGGQAP